MNKLKLSYGQHPLIFLNSLIICYALGICLAEKFFTSIFFLPSKYLFLLLCVNFSLAIYATMRKAKYTFIFVLSLFLLIGLLRGNLAFSLAPDNIAHYENQSATIQGKIVSAPKIRQDAKQIYHLSYVVDVQTIKVKQERKSVSGKIYLYAQQKDLNNLAKINDTISTSGKIRLIRGYHNTGLIDRELLAREQGIYSSLSTGKAPLKILAHDNSFSILKFSTAIQQKVLQALQEVMPENNANTIYAMLFGGYNDIDEELLEAFSITGIIHILSVSGSHISLLIGFILNLTQLLRLSRRLSLCSLIAVIVFYAILCGGVPPVIRASVMGLLTAVALHLQRETTASNLLSITALVMLCIDPLLLFHISFQLSFASTAGLVYLMPALRQKFKFLPKFIADNLALTLSAQLMALPIIAWYFNSLSLSSLLANLLIIPPLEFVIILGLLGTMIALCMPFCTVLAQIIFVQASLIFTFASKLTFALAKMPFANVYLPTIPFCLVVIYYLCMFLCLKQFALLKQYAKYIAPILCIIFAICFYLNQKPSDLQIHFIDVGQGDAMLIITPKQHAILLDTGGTLNSDFDIGKRVTLPYLRHYGITRLDYLILSHSDADHAGGAKAILAKIPVAHLIIADEDLNNYAKVLQIPLQDKILQNALIAKADMQFNLDGIDFRFLNSPNAQGKSANEASNIVKLTYHNFSALFTGDLTQAGEQQLLQAHANLQSTILKVAHHGSKTSSSQKFLTAVKPQFAIISAGKYNSFGHPHEEVVERLNALPTKILRTDLNGAIIFTTDGYSMQVQTFDK